MLLAVMLQAHKTLAAVILHVTWLTLTATAVAMASLIINLFSSVKSDTSPEAVKLIFTVVDAEGGGEGGDGRGGVGG